MKKRILAVVSALSVMLSSNWTVFAEDYSAYAACESSVVSVNEDAGNSIISIIFDAEIDASTVTADTVYLNKDGSTDKISIESNVSADNKTITFSTASLESGAKYAVIINGVKCADSTTDVTPSDNYTFTVGAPTVTAQNIADGASPVTNVANASSYRTKNTTTYWDYTNSVYNGDFLEITFSEDIAESTVTKDSLTVTYTDTGDRAQQISYTPIVDGDTVKIDLSNLYSNFTFNVAVTSDITDKNGAAVSETSFSFTTGLIAKAAHMDGKNIELVSIGKKGTVTVADGTETTKAQLTDGLMEGTGIDCSQWNDTSKEFYTVDLGRLYDIAAVGAFYPQAKWHLYVSNVYVSDIKPTQDYLSTAEKDAELGLWGQGDVFYGNNNINKALSETKRGQYVALKKTSDGIARLNEILVFAYKDKFEVTTTNIKNGASPVTNVENASSYGRPDWGMSYYWDYTNSVYEGDYVEITFSKNLASETVTKDSVRVTQGTDKQINYTPIVDGNKVKIDLSYLYSNFDYNISISSDVQDEDGSFAESYSFSFTTGLIAKAPHQDGKTIKLVSIGKKAVLTATDGTETAKVQLTDGLMETTSVDCNCWSDTSKEFFTVDLGGLYNIAAVGAFYPNVEAKYHLYTSDMFVSETKPTSEYLDANSYDVRFGAFGEGNVVNGNNNVNKALTTPKVGQYVALKKVPIDGTGIARLNEILVFAYTGGTFNEVSSDFDNVTVPITNVLNSADLDQFNTDSCYKEKLEITFDKELMAGSVTKDSLIITQNNTGAKKTYTPEVVKNKVYIDMCTLESDREYTIKATSDIMAKDTSSLNEKELTFKTGLIAKAAHRDGKVIKLVSKGKTVTNSAGGYTGVYDEQYATNTNLQTLTNGILETEGKERIRYNQGDYVTVDLGTDYEVAAVGAYWPVAAWHLYNTSVFITENKPTEADMQAADVSIAWWNCWETISGTNTNLDINNTINSMTAENGRYVTFKKNSDGHAYLSELYVFAYVDKDAQIDFYFTNTETDIEAKAVGTDAATDVVYTASYDNGMLVEVKQGAVKKGENYTYKGFVWEKATINPILPAIDF